jgi:hypothetical protein
MATFKNLLVEQGATFSQVVSIADAYGNPLDLTEYEYRGQIRKSYASRTFTAFTVTSEDPTSGDIEIGLTATQTDTLREGRYVYDIEIEDASGVVLRALEGIVTVTPGVTRPAEE